VYDGVLEMAGTEDILAIGDVAIVVGDVAIVEVDLRPLLSRVTRPAGC